MYYKNAAKSDIIAKSDFYVISISIKHVAFGNFDPGKFQWISWEFGSVLFICAAVGVGVRRGSIVSSNLHNI